MRYNNQSPILRSRLQNFYRLLRTSALTLGGLFLVSQTVLGQGVTTAAMNGLVTDQQGEALPGANVVAVHVESGTIYGSSVRSGGSYNIPNMRVGGPYTVTASFVGFTDQVEENVYLSLGQNLRLDFTLAEEAIELDAVVVTAEQDEVLNSDRTGAVFTKHSFDFCHTYIHEI